MLRAMQKGIVRNNQEILNSKKFVIHLIRNGGVWLLFIYNV